MATTVTTKDRQQLVHNLSMDNIHHLKNIIYHQEKEYEKFEKIFSCFVIGNFNKITETNRRFRRNHMK